MCIGIVFSKRCKCAPAYLLSWIMFMKFFKKCLHMAKCLEEVIIVNVDICNHHFDNRLSSQQLKREQVIRVYQEWKSLSKYWIQWYLHMRGCMLCASMDLCVCVYLHKMIDLISFYISAWYHIYRSAFHNTTQKIYQIKSLNAQMIGKLSDQLE